MFSLVITLALIGFLVWLVTNYVPMLPIFKIAIYAVVAYFVIMWLSNVLGISDVPVPRLR